MSGYGEQGLVSTESLKMEPLSHDVTFHKNRKSLNEFTSAILGGFSDEKYNNNHHNRTSKLYTAGLDRGKFKKKFYQVQKNYFNNHDERRSIQNSPNLS